MHKLGQQVEVLVKQEELKYSQPTLRNEKGKEVKKIELSQPLIKPIDLGKEKEFQ